MKNWSRRAMCLLLAMLTVMAFLPLAAAEENTEIYTAEKWIAYTNEKYSLKLNEDGTGVFISNGKTFKGEWTLGTGTKTVYLRGYSEWDKGLGSYADFKSIGTNILFTYDQYGKRTATFRVCKKIDKDKSQTDEIVLYGGKRVFILESALAARLKEAEEKMHTLKWKEKIDLSFVSFSINDAKICRTLEEAYNTNKKDTYTIKKGKQYIVLTGNIKNKANEQIYLDCIYAEALIDGQTYNAKVENKSNNEDYLRSGMDTNTSAQLYIYAEVPEKVAKTFQTARIRFSFKDNLKYDTSHTYAFADGEYCFQLTISGAKAKAMHKAAATRKKTYFSVGKNKSLPKPSSYTDLIWTGGPWINRGKQTIPISKKSITYHYRYKFRAKYSDGKLANLFNAYVSGLKKDGFKVKQVKESDLYSYAPSFSFDSWNYYAVYKGNTLLGWIQFNAKYSDMYVSVIS